MKIISCVYVCMSFISVNSIGQMIYVCMDAAVLVQCILHYYVCYSIQSCRTSVFVCVFVRVRVLYAAEKTRKLIYSTTIIPCWKNVIESTQITFQDALINNCDCQLLDFGDSRLPMLATLATCLQLQRLHGEVNNDNDNNNSILAWTFFKNIQEATCGIRNSSFLGKIHLF